MADGIARCLRVIGVVGLVALGLPAPSSAEDNIITACISRDGRVRIVSPQHSFERSRGVEASPCQRGERLVRWNITGPEGPQGIQGLQGPAGPEGPQGPEGPGFAGIQHYTVGNGDLRPVGGGLFGFSFGPAPGGTFSTAAAGLLAGVHLPQGAHVLAMRANVFDNSTSDLTIELIEQDLATGNGIVVASATSAGAAGAPYAIDTVLTTAQRVDNAQFHYFVRVSPNPGWTGTSLQVLGVSVTYTLLPPQGS